MQSHLLTFENDFSYLRTALLTSHWTMSCNYWVTIFLQGFKNYNIEEHEKYICKWNIINYIAIENLGQTRTLIPKYSNSN